MPYSERIQSLVNSVVTQFNYRTKTEGRKRGLDFGISLNTEIKEDATLWLSFSKSDDKHVVVIPLPYMENGVSFIQHNEVIRALSPFWVEKEQREMDYLAAIYSIILNTPVGLISPELTKATSYLQRVINSFKFENTSVIIHMFQRAINEVVIKMPLHETFMNSYVINNRLIVIDEVFDSLNDPRQRLIYQVDKAVKYFQMGWTSIGLSDGSLDTKNYILKFDLRKLTPCGLKYHNPQRNLYSTLGMKGDELPNVCSQSAKELEDRGIERKGWNFLTAFVDIPDIFEDQIMVNNIHKDKFVTYTCRRQVFGEVVVKENQVIKTGEILCICPDQESEYFDVKCEEAKVLRIKETHVTVGGTLTKAYNIVIEYKRYFKDGFKITNMHGNKGVIRMADLGYAVDPRTGEKRRIDVIVGAKTVGKRKNYGQIVEALINCLIEKDCCQDQGRLIIQDEWTQPFNEIEDGLAKRGFNSDGTWQCNTVGNIKAVCGKVFWGVIKTPEDQVWKENATFERNSKGVRTAGLKFSHVEFRALETRFGSDNPLTEEIMSYAQGSGNINELFQILESKKGMLPNNKAIFNLSEVKPLNQDSSTIIPGQYIDGTIVDEFFQPNGFVLKLPLPFMTLVDCNGETYEGSPLMYEQMSDEEKGKYTIYTTNSLYIPNGDLRKCWRHSTGKYGLSDIGVLANNVITMGHKLLADYENPITHRLYYNSINTFFAKIAKMMGTKHGEISTHGMAVRYPYSCKAVATLSTTLPANTVEIHRSMAKIMKVSNNDVVIAERFPCLGFMSVRPQKVRITDDPMCRYTIRVSGNSLVSQNLDFDGDVLYLAAFHTPKSKVALMKEIEMPNEICQKFIKILNERKGKPHTKEYTLQDFNITPFSRLTNEEHATIVEKNTGVKSQTGPVIALTYNIMRIVENSNLADNQDMKVAIEMFLEKAAQSVFEQKHGGKSLYEVVIDGICTANVEMLAEVKFDRGTTEVLCELIRTKARAIGIHDLEKAHFISKTKGTSNIISKIVKAFNKIYFASRSSLEGISLLKIIKEEPSVDVPSTMFKWILAGNADKIKIEVESKCSK